MKGYPGYNTTIYEDDVNDISAPDPQIKGLRRVGVRGTRYPMVVNPGRRPRRKPGESPLDPPRE